MSDDVELTRRRWEDVRTEIRAAVADAQLELRLTISRLDRDIQQLRVTVYGDPAIRQAGIVDRLDKIEGRMGAIEDKIDTLVDRAAARDNQFLGAQKAFYVLATLVVAVGGPPALIAILRAFGVSP